MRINIRKHFVPKIWREHNNWKSTGIKFHL